MTTQKIRIKLESFDHELLNTSCQEIIEKVQTVEAKIVGPIALPTRKEFIVYYVHLKHLVMKLKHYYKQLFLNQKKILKQVFHKLNKIS